MRAPRSLPFLPAVLLAAAIPAISLMPARRAHADAAHGTLDVADLKIGMKGYGLTVFKGTEPEKFDVEIVGVLSQFRPNQDLILIKTPHERLNIAHTVAGMSGSPIFIDGKMIGAYAYGWTFGAEPLAGVTPIKNMLQDLAQPVPPELLRPIPIAPAHGPLKQTAAKPLRGKHASLDGPGNYWDGAIESYDVGQHAKQVGARVAATLQPPAGSGLSAASTMVSLSGLGDRSTRAIADLLAPMGFETTQGGGAGAKVDPGAPTKYVDGGAIGVQLIRGDLSAMGLGTVTRVEGDKLVAFGHPMMHGGISALPTAIGKVHWIMASSQRSFKIGEAARPLGTLVNDRQASIVIDTKVEAPVFPVEVEVVGVPDATKKKWSMEVVHDRFLTPTFVGVAMGNAVEGTLSERRDATWKAHTRIQIKGYGAIEVDDFGVAIGGTPNADDFVRSRAARAVGMILNNSWEWAQIERVDLKVSFTFARDVYSLRGSHALEDTVDAGGKLRVAVRMWQFNGPDEVRTIEVPIPKELAGREVDVFLTPGWMDGPELPAPESLAALIANIPRLAYAPDVLVASYRVPEQGIAHNGSVIERLPPSMLDTLRTAGDSEAPEAVPGIVRYTFPVGKFLDGRDHVHVKVREVVRLAGGDERRPIRLARSPRAR